MKLQVLVATMQQKDLSKIEEMNICSDVIFANQSNEYSYIEETRSFGTVKMITTATRGVGMNRNLALLWADGDYLLFSDDDIYYVDNYKEIVINAFNKIPEADAIIFNVKTLHGISSRRVNSKIRRLHYFNSMSYGAVRIAVKRSAVKRENIMFNLNFGGGTQFSSGEDTLFIMDMLKKGLKLYAYPEYIATVDDSVGKSTWFTGYNKKYYYDKGVFFRTLSKKMATILCLQDLLRHRYYKQSGLTFWQAYGLMKKGIGGYRNLREYDEKIDWL